MKSNSEDKNGWIRENAFDTVSSNAIVITRNTKRTKNWGFDIGHSRSCRLCYNIYIHWLYILSFFNNSERVYTASAKTESRDLHTFPFREKLAVLFIDNNHKLCYWLTLHGYKEISGKRDTQLNSEIHSFLYHTDFGGSDHHRKKLP